MNQHESAIMNLGNCSNSLLEKFGSPRLQSLIPRAPKVTAQEATSSLD